MWRSNNIDGILSLMAEDCQYHDTIYLVRPDQCSYQRSSTQLSALANLLQEPFVGKAAIRGYFEKVSSIVPGDLQFAIENMSTGDRHNVGVKW